MKKLRILIVDDSTNLRKVIRRYIESGAYEGIELQFREAGNGEEAENALQDGLIENEPIDLIFLDWMMPKFSGREFLEKIRGTEIFRTKPAIIMLTAETYAEQINACLQFGVASYITKPFQAEALIEAVKRVLNSDLSGVIKHAV